MKNQGSAAAAKAIFAEFGAMTLGDNSDDDDGDCSSVEHFCDSLPRKTLKNIGN